jgi:hypothetical protein
VESSGSYSPTLLSYSDAKPMLENAHPVFIGEAEGTPHFALEVRLVSFVDPPPYNTFSSLHPNPFARNAIFLTLF